MADTRVIEGLEYRKHYKSNSYVTSDGLHVKRSYLDSDGTVKYSTVHIRSDADGRRFIDTPKYGKHYIDEIVAGCFGPIKPKDDGDYELVHKDGNISNDSHLNLSWRPVGKSVPVPGVQMRWDKSTYTRVSIDGIVVEKRYTDRNTGKKVTYQPRINVDKNAYNRRYIESNQYGKVYIDEMVARAFGMQQPGPDYVISHKDGNWQNDHKDNLLWVPASHATKTPPSPHINPFNPGGSGFKTNGLFGG